DRFVLDYERVRTAKKRGGRSERFHLEFGEAEREIAAAQPPRPDALDAYFESEGTRHLLSLAVETLRREFEEKGKAKQFRVVERYHVQDASDPPAYAQVAADLGITVTDVTNWLTQTRREFRRIVLETLRAMAGSDEEYRSEALAVLGVVA